MPTVHGSARVGLSRVDDWGRKREEEQLPVMSPLEHTFPEEQAHGTVGFAFLFVSVSWGLAVLRTRGSRDCFWSLLGN